MWFRNFFRGSSVWRIKTTLVQMHAYIMELKSLLKPVNRIISHNLYSNYVPVNRYISFLRTKLSPVFHVNYTSVQITFWSVTAN